MPRALTRSAAPAPARAGALFGALAALLLSACSAATIHGIHGGRGYSPGDLAVAAANGGGAVPVVTFGADEAAAARIASGLEAGSAATPVPFRAVATAPANRFRIVAILNPASPLAAARPCAADAAPETLGAGSARSTLRLAFCHGTVEARGLTTAAATEGTGGPAFDALVRQAAFVLLPGQAEAQGGNGDFVR